MKTRVVATRRRRLAIRRSVRWDIVGRTSGRQRGVRARDVRFWTHWTYLCSMAWSSAGRASSADARARVIVCSYVFLLNVWHCSLPQRPRLDGHRRILRRVTLAAAATLCGSLGARCWCCGSILSARQERHADCKSRGDCDTCPHVSSSRPRYTRGERAYRSAGTSCRAPDAAGPVEPGLLLQHFRRRRFRPVALQAPILSPPARAGQRGDPTPADSVCSRRPNLAEPARFGT
jgi:hypothetical protein